MSRAGSILSKRESNVQGTQIATSETGDIGSQKRSIDSTIANNEPEERRDSSVLYNRSIVFDDERKNEDRPALSLMSTPDVGGRLKTIESFEESPDESSTPNSKTGELRDSISNSLRSNIHSQSEAPIFSYGSPGEVSLFGDDAITPSKPGELFEC